MGHLQGLDGGIIYVGRWVAVAYDKAASIQNEEEVKVDFIKKKKDGSYRWPNMKDASIIDKLYIFCSSTRVQKIGNDYIIYNEGGLDKLYKSYQNKYMTSNN